MKTAGIIGGLDFIGCDITLKFLSENYKVKVVEIPTAAKKPPIIKTGLKAGENLMIYRFDLNNEYLMAEFLEDCNVVVHCGVPYKLNLQVPQSVYIPVITCTESLIKAAEKSSLLKMIVFITSVAVLNHLKIRQLSKPDKKQNNRFSEQAFRHAGKIISDNINHVSGIRIEILVITPVVVNDNLLTNSRQSTLAALQHIFSHKLEHDIYFRMLAGRNLMETMINVVELPDKVFNCIQSAY